MGQYHKVVNLDKREFLHPHKLGCGLKLWEQMANHPGTGAGLIALLACSNGRGSGDFDTEANWHGPERDMAIHNISPGPMPEDYPDTAKGVIGRWAGDRIAVVGDYAENFDIPNSPVPASAIYRLCSNPEGADEDENPEEFFTDITEAVARVIEHELNGKFKGDGWKDWEAA